MNILILGAGPAGLTIGNRLKEKGVDSFLILEKEYEAGGLCRSVKVDGIPIDMGPHWLDDRATDVMNYLYQFLPKNELAVFDRNGKVLMPNGKIIGSPIESYIWQMDREDKLDYLESISAAGCNTGTPMPEKFVDWIYWKLGTKIAENYMLPYNQKLYGDNLDEMGTYWLYKLPSVSFRETIMSCLDNKFYGKQPGHDRFYYSLSGGSGEVWSRMEKKIQSHIKYNKSIMSIDFDSHRVRTWDNETYTADLIITTIPWREFKELVGMPQELKDKIPMLKSVALEIRYVAEEIDTDAQWIYCSGNQVPFHRATVLRNINPSTRGMVVETRKERTQLVDEKYPALYSHMNEYAYPVNTIGKPEIISQLIEFAKSKKVLVTGRWGEHQHHNSDVVVKLALHLADQIVSDFN